MKLLAKSLAIASVVVLWCGTARASYCGAVSYCENSPNRIGRNELRMLDQMPDHRQSAAADRPCSEPRTVTKTVLERVVVPKSVTVVQHVPETRYRDEVYTVTKPVWEIRIKQVPYTVMRPVWETCVKQVLYTVMKPVWETLIKTGRIHSDEAGVGNVRQGSSLHGHETRLGNAR